MNQLKHFIRIDQYSHNNCKKCGGQIIKEPGMLPHCKDCGHITNQTAAKTTYKRDQRDWEETPEGSQWLYAETHK